MKRKRKEKGKKVQMWKNGQILSENTHTHTHSHTCTGKQEVESHWSSVTVQHEQKTRHHAEEDTNAKNSFTFLNKRNKTKPRKKKQKHQSFPERLKNRLGCSWLAEAWNKNKLFMTETSVWKCSGGRSDLPGQDSVSILLKLFLFVTHVTCLCWGFSSISTNCQTCAEQLT